MTNPTGETRGSTSSWGAVPETAVTWATAADHGGVYINHRRSGASLRAVERVWLKSLLCMFCDKEVPMRDIGAQFEELIDLDESVAEAVCPDCRALGHV